MLDALILLLITTGIMSWGGAILMIALHSWDNHKLKKQRRRERLWD